MAQELVTPADIDACAPPRDGNDRLHERITPPRARKEDEDEEPQLHFWVAVATLGISTIIIAICAKFMVDSIDAVASNGGLSTEFVGLILLPIVGNAAEHATAVTVAIKDKMDLAIGVAIGSSMQVALFLIPLLVIVGWGLGDDQMSLSFDLFQVAILFVAVLLVNYLISDGQSHWLEGLLLISLYIIIAVCSYGKTALREYQLPQSNFLICSVPRQHERKRLHLIVSLMKPPNCQGFRENIAAIY